MSPGRRVAIKKRGDASLWLERIVLTHLEGSAYLFLTPDREIVREDLGISAQGLVSEELARSADAPVSPGPGGAEDHAAA